MDRRRFLALSAVTPLAGCALARPQRLEIAVETPFPARAGEPAWFHPRPCLVPGGVLLTMQSISGSDHFGQVFWTRSNDGGRTWRDPEAIPALGRREVGGGYIEATCDVVPQYHAPSGRVLAMGHNVYYRDGRLARPQFERYPAYVTGDGHGAWSDRKTVEWSHRSARRIYTCGCAQRLGLDDGDLLVPISFGGPRRVDRAATTIRCTFDGREVRVAEQGTVLRLAVKRGLLEPSLARFAGRYFMTIRAEDGHGYVTTSTDGLAWQPMQHWCFDDGEALVMSTTQQHWIAMPHGLYLVYTRRDATNRRVMRFRAPLYVARVDPRTQRLLRATERVAIPLRGDPVGAPQDVARMGNFHTLVVSPTEAWITVGEARPTNRWVGDVLLARLRWL